MQIVEEWSCYWRMENGKGRREQPLASASERIGVTGRKAYKPVQKCLVCLSSLWNAPTAAGKLTSPLKTVRHTLATCLSMSGTATDTDAAKVATSETKVAQREDTKEGWVQRESAASGTGLTHVLFYVAFLWLDLFSCDLLTMLHLAGLALWKGSWRKEAVGRTWGRWSMKEPLYLMLLPWGCLQRHRDYGRMEH